MSDVEITEVSVTVHEKRNHPHEYGHYDCEVRLTAKVPQAKLIYDRQVKLIYHPPREENSSCEPDPLVPCPEPERTAQQIIASLRTAARAHVNAECDEWLARIAAEREAEAKRDQARMKLRQKRWDLGHLQREIEQMERDVERGDVDPDAWPDDEDDDDEEVDDG